MEYENQDEIWKKLASSYADTYGTELKKQLGEADNTDTENLDKKVKKKIDAVKSKKRIYIPAVVAACLILAFMLPQLTKNTGLLPAPPQEPGREYEMIYLSFDLPDKFSVSKIEQDYEKTVYTLKNTEHDDVVMTLKKEDGGFDAGGFGVIEINGLDTYMLSKSGYNILIFGKDGILYELSCRYDINTLISLGGNII